MSENNIDKDNKEKETTTANEQVASESLDNNTETVASSTKPSEEIDWKAKYYYLAAETENARKRAEREKDNLLKFGSEKILSDLVDVIDNFERTLDMLKSDKDQKVVNIVVGLNMVRKIFIDSINKHGLTQIESLGKDFDPNFHEAMGQEYAEGKRPNEILKEYQKGYVLNGRLMRAAKVIVASDKQ